MFMDLPPKLWVPEKPAIIRPADPSLRTRDIKRELREGMFPFATPMFGGGAAPKVPSVIAFTAATTSATNATSYSFATQAIGTASSDRFIVVCAYSLNAGSTNIPATCTVAGQACTRLAALDSSTIANAAIFITNAAVTSGTTATIVVSNYGGAGNSVLNCSIAVYAVTKLTSNAADATDSGNLSGNNLNLAISAGGVAVVATTCRNSSAGDFGLGFSFFTKNTDTAMENGAFAAGSGASLTSQTLTDAISAASGDAFVYVAVTLK